MTRIHSYVSRKNTKYLQAAVEKRFSCVLSLKSSNNFFLWFVCLFVCMSWNCVCVWVRNKVISSRKTKKEIEYWYLFQHKLQTQGWSWSWKPDLLRGKHRILKLIVFIIIFIFGGQTKRKRGKLLCKKFGKKIPPPPSTCSWQSAPNSVQQQVLMAWN